jgi:hypothetical protein
MNDKVARGMVAFDEWLENLSEEDRRRMVDRLMAADPKGSFNRLQVSPDLKVPWHSEEGRLH